MDTDDDERKTDGLNVFVVVKVSNDFEIIASQSLSVEILDTENKERETDRMSGFEFVKVNNNFEIFI